MRELALCGRGGDWQEDEIAKDDRFRPSHRHNMLQATTWDDLLLGLEDDISSVTRAGKDKHENVHLAIVLSPSTVVEVPHEDPSDAQIQSPPRITRMTYCFDRNDRERRSRSIDNVVRRLDPYDGPATVTHFATHPNFNAFNGETSSLEYTSSYEDSSSLEYSDDDDDGDVEFEHWC
jgi:hypothetical protein